MNGATEPVALSVFLSCVVKYEFQKLVFTLHLLNAVKHIKTGIHLYTLDQSLAAVNQHIDTHKPSTYFANYICYGVDDREEKILETLHH